MVYFISIVSIILLSSLVICIVDNSKFVYGLYYLFSIMWIFSVLFIKTAEHITISMMDTSVIVFFYISIVIFILLIIRSITGFDFIGKLHSSKIRRFIFHDHKFLLEQDFYWSAPERYGIYIASASAYMDVVNNKVSIDIKKCENSGYSPKDHPSYNKFLEDVDLELKKKISEQIIEENKNM